MKRFALFLAALAVTTTAMAADEVEFKHSGDFRVRYFNDINSTGAESSGQKSDTTGRFKWNISARKGEKLQGYLSLIHNSQFGAQATYSGDYDTATTNNLFLVNRAWGWWKATESLSFKVGRFGIEFGDGSIFAENDWDNYATAHEGLLASWDWEFARLALAGIKTHDFPQTLTTAAPNDPERNVYLLIADVKNVPEAIKLANIHLVQVRSEANAAAGATLTEQNFLQYGLTVGGDVSNFLYKGTFSLQNGSFNKTAALDQKINASMFDVMLGYQMPETMGLKISVGYHMDSGDDAAGAAGTGDKKTYQAPYFDNHNYAGLMDVVDWGNLTYYNVNASLMIAEDLELGAGYYMFSRTSADALPTPGKNTRSNITKYATAAEVAEGEKALGSELDVFTNKSYDGGIKIGARFGLFMPGAYWKDGEAKRDKNLMDFMLQGSIPF